ncbi:hypothetical protein D3C86_1815050 [compost metagenome]
MAFHWLAVILHLIERCRIAVAINNLFALLAARTGDNHFIGIDFDRALGHDDVASEGDDVTLHIKRLRVRFDMNRLLSVARHRKGRETGGQQRAGNDKFKAEFVCFEFHRRF